MRATQQIRYAIYGVFDLAYNGGARPVPLLEVGRRQAIPARYLEQIFQRLRRAGLVASKRGPGGGYSLAKSADSIRIADVIRAVQGDLLVLPEAEVVGEGSPTFLWDWVRADLERALAAHSIADLCREAAARGIARAPAEPAAYEI